MTHQGTTASCSAARRDGAIRGLSHSSNPAQQTLGEVHRLSLCAHESGVAEVYSGRV
jgi:hypothetical protein